MRTREHGSQLFLQKFTQGIKKNKVLDIPLSKSTVTKDKLLWPYAQSRSYMLSKDINICIRKWKIETTLTRTSDPTPRVVDMDDQIFGLK